MKVERLFILKNQFDDSILFIGNKNAIFNYIDNNTIYNIDLYDFESNYLKSYNLRAM